MGTDRVACVVYSRGQFRVQAVNVAEADHIFLLSLAGHMGTDRVCGMDEFRVQVVNVDEFFFFYDPDFVGTDGNRPRM